MKLLEGDLKADWGGAITILTDRIAQECNKTMFSRQTEELLAYVNLSMADRPGIPKTQVSAVTIAVPGNIFKSHYKEAMVQKYPPVLQVDLKSSSHRSWCFTFSVLNLAFGKINRMGTGLEIQQNDNGWEEDSSLLVSFYTPNKVLEKDHQTAIIHVNFILSPQIIGNHMELATSGVTIFRSNFGDKKHVFKSRYLPNQYGSPVLCNVVKFSSTRIVLNVVIHTNESTGSIKTLTGSIACRVLLRRSYWNTRSRFIFAGAHRS